MSDRLYRSRDDRMLAGVAGGVAEMLDIDPSLVRIVWALLVVLTGGIAPARVHHHGDRRSARHPMASSRLLARPPACPRRGGADANRPDAARCDGWVAPNAPVDQAQGTGSAGGWLAPDGSVGPDRAAPDAGAGSSRADPTPSARSLRRADRGRDPHRDRRVLPSPPVHARHRPGTLVAGRRDRRPVPCSSSSRSSPARRRLSAPRRRTRGANSSPATTGFVR